MLTKTESHFRDIDIQMTEHGPDGSTSGRLPATGVYFRTTPADWFFDWHPATRRQYVINLDAPNKITASDGETRIIGVGEIILIEDMHGKGHLSGGTPDEAIRDDPHRLMERGFRRAARSRRLWGQQLDSHAVTEVPRLHE
jgi:hypothetical protein